MEDNLTEERDSESSSDSDTICDSPFLDNLFQRYREFKVANGTDHCVMVGVQEDRVKDEGGENIKFDIAGVFGIAYKSPRKDNLIVSGIPWQRVDIHR